MHVSIGRDQITSMLRLFLLAAAEGAPSEFIDGAFLRTPLVIRETTRNLTFSNSVVVESLSDAPGGAVFIDSPSLTMRFVASSFISCSSSVSGGAISARASVATFLRCCFVNCSSVTFSALYLTAGDSGIEQLRAMRCPGRDLRGTLASDLIGLTDGTQSMNSLNVSRSARALGSSAVRVLTNASCAVDYSNFFGNSAQFVLGLRARGAVRSCNVVNNTNTRKLLVVCCGGWTISGSIFIRNVGNGFESCGGLFVRSSFFDFEIPAGGNFTDVTRGHATATRAISDVLSGECYGRSLSLGTVQFASVTTSARFAGFVMFGLGLVFLGVIVYSYFSAPKVVGQTARPARAVITSGFIRPIDEPNDIDVGDA
jgi:hypothetical protein